MSILSGQARPDNLDTHVHFVRAGYKGAPGLIGGPTGLRMGIPHTDAPTQFAFLLIEISSNCFAFAFILLIYSLWAGRFRFLIYELGGLSFAFAFY